MAAAAAVAWQQSDAETDATRLQHLYRQCTLHDEVTLLRVQVANWQSTTLPGAVHTNFTL